ncbi:hypothetical protein [Curtobacterium sp. ISL-83]|uniref:hypothetical protein n=1 Tax=Curtobacterium sp. ISL-83 TaxID=2819145 RepID=UPI001BE7E126|nr:hypothetical protein [Curtobacterium sp. ISL-83]MBT2501060.1 hypothetical protein [Curtobacterium sp. ISL-83]
MEPEFTAADLRRAFAPEPGVDAMVLPDATVIGSTGADVDRLRAALARSPWHVLDAGPEDELGPTRVRPAPGVLVNFSLGLGAPITFDFDLREIIDDASLTALLDLLRFVASSTGKDVSMHAEGDSAGSAVLEVGAIDGSVMLRPLH